MCHKNAANHYLHMITQNIYSTKNWTLNDICVLYVFLLTAQMLLHIWNIQNLKYLKSVINDSTWAFLDTIPVLETFWEKVVTYILVKLEGWGETFSQAVTPELLGHLTLFSWSACKWSIVISISLSVTPFHPLQRLNWHSSSWHYSSGEGETKTSVLYRGNRAPYLPCENG